jgi:hypothetical protein
MPFGIPPTKLVADAAGDYASASEQEIAELIATVVQPIAIQVEGLGNIAQTFAKMISKAVNRQAKGVNNEVEDLTSGLGDMLGYMSQEMSSYVSQLSAIAAGQVGSSEAAATPSPPPPPYCPAEFVSTPIVQSPPPPPVTPPKLRTKFPCPTFPGTFPPGSNIVGTPEWCANANSLIAFLEGASGGLLDWLQGKSDPLKWLAAFDDAFPDPTGNTIFDQVKSFLKFVAQFLIIEAGSAALTIVDIIRCSQYYAQVLTPIRSPGAYTSLLVVRNLIKWLSGSRLGSQSYLGFTLSTAITLPQFEQYIEMLLRYLCSIEIPTYPEISDAWVRGFIGDEQLQCLLRLNGLDPTMYAPFLAAKGEQLSAREAIYYTRRFGLTEETQYKLLRKAGIIDNTVLTAVQSMYDELPSVADTLHWLQRNVFNTDYVEKYNLMDGFEDRFWSQYSKYLLPQGYTKERAANEYAAHWIQPSPTQMQEFVYRLRPGKDGVSAPFTTDDYQRILAEQDYAPLARQWFADTVYKVPALTYVRDMFRFGVVDSDALRSVHLDLGYSPTDADSFVQVDTVKQRRQQATSGSGWSPAALRKAVAVGVLKDEDVRPKMAAQGYTDTDTDDLLARAKSDLQYRVLSRALSTQLTQTVSQVRQAQTVGVMDSVAAAAALVSLGWTQTQADGISALTAAQAKTSRVRTAISTVRSAFIHGEVSSDDATIALQRLGIVPDAVADYIAVWTVQLTGNVRRLNAQQIVKEVTEGVITSDEAAVRLGNLGYSDADTLIFIGDAARNTVTTAAALDTLDGLTGKQRAAQLGQLASTTIGLSRRIVQQLKEQEPPSKLLKWAVAGIVTQAEMESRLSLYGWADDAIAKWVADAKERGAWNEEEEANPES